MAFSNFFSGKIPKIGDEFFGVMLFMEDMKDPAKNYFECRRTFRPSGELIEIGLDGQLDGPTQRQKTFFSRIENDYFLLVPRLAEVIEKEFGAWMTLPVIKDFTKEFKPNHLVIPTCEQQPIVWEITFDTIHDRNHIVTVGMLDYEPQYVRVDG